MAFESKKEKMNKVLNETLKESKKPRARRVGRPAGKAKFPYQFTLKPDNREKLDQIAINEGFNSVSAFLDDWIEKY
ncbi:hypothetical protein DIX59_09000 [Streptococcus iniae]|uniref:hypothetical protein n=1 Tax=Streptococcus iniae TaxID=1346 RepID=UPI0002DD07E7|nr:hypothetical protein [Streptococcus iniae]ESR10516.1 hypothetical protein IUSA1_01185 [Streptococcus iniae IUSA1]KYJ81248.1 hypothetical protein NA30_04430 [Streptococcus iniae]RMI73077.1 hypothetical protein DIX59_09000 [Streptococcus iniae]HEK4517276.1 hypothetical protein [Streptococcus iniae]